MSYLRTQSDKSFSKELYKDLAKNPLTYSLSFLVYGVFLSSKNTRWWLVNIRNSCIWLVHGIRIRKTVNEKTQAVYPWSIKNLITQRFSINKYMMEHAFLFTALLTEKRVTLMSHQGHQFFRFYLERRDLIGNAI